MYMILRGKETKICEGTLVGQISCCSSVSLDVF